MGGAGVEIESSAGPALGSPMIPRRPVVEDCEFDVTAMVDLVFLMNLFFLVTWVTQANAEMDMPAARNCVSSDPDKSVFFVMLVGDSQGPKIYLGESASGKLIGNGDDLESQITEAVEAASAGKKDTVLIKTEKQVELRDVFRVAAAAQAVEGMTVRLAVVEKSE